MTALLLGLLLALPSRAAQIEGTPLSPVTPISGAASVPQPPALPLAEPLSARVELPAQAALSAEAAVPQAAPLPQAQGLVQLNESLAAAAAQPGGSEAQSASARASLDLAFDGGISWLSADASCGHHCGLKPAEQDFPTDDEGDPFIVPGHLEPLLPSARDDKTWTKETSLHAHSYFSDGTMAPEAVVELAAKAGVRKLALSDHDTVAGIRRAHARAKELGIELRPSVELTARGGVHIGAVDVDITNEKLAAVLAGTRASRYEQARYVVAYLNGPQVVSDLASIPGPKAKAALDALEEFRAGGGKITLDEVVAQSKHAEGGTIERPHIARALVAHGLLENVDDAFETFLKKGVKLPEDVPRDPTVEQILDAVHAAGGKAFLNHPYTVRGKGDAERERNAYELLKKGFDGIEVYRPPLDSAGGRRKQERSVAKYLTWADELGLMVGAGSDFHGNDVRLDELAVWMPKPLEAALDKGLAQSHARAVAVLEGRPPSRAFAAGFARPELETPLGLPLKLAFVVLLLAAAALAAAVYAGAYLLR